RADPDCRPRQEIDGDRRSQFPDNWARWSVRPFRDNPRIAALKFESRDPAMHSLLAWPEEEPRSRRQPVRAVIPQTDGDGRVFPTKRAAYPEAVRNPAEILGAATSTAAHSRLYSPYVPLGA